MSTILTNKGNYFPFHAPHEHKFDVEEIAHALSNICRFTGHVSEFYSVAQHSVLVSCLVPSKYKLAALFHDASEAYLGDVASPLKALLPEYKAIEKHVEKAIADQFPWADGLCPLHPCIKHADGRMLVTERARFLPTKQDDVWPDYEPAPFQIDPMTPEWAKRFFILRYKELTS